MATVGSRPFAAFAALCLAAAGCQGATFGGHSGEGQSADGDAAHREDQNSSGDATSVDQASADAASSGSDGSLGNTAGGANGGGDAGNGNDGANGGGSGDGPDEIIAGSSCRLLNKSRASAVLPGGPPVAVRVASLGGTVEGDTYHFTFAAYQGCYGAEAKNNRGDATPHTLSTYVSSITGAFFGGETGKALGEASAQGYIGQCGTADQWNLTQPKPYAVKHLYRGVVRNAHAANCAAEIQETEKAFWVRENGNEYGGCFALGTPIRLADGRDQVASLVVEGTLLYNPITKRPARVTRVVIGPEATIGMFVVGFDGREVTVTSTHPFPTAAGLKTAAELRTTDEVQDAEGRSHRLTRLEQLAPNPAQVVVNFIVNPDSTDPRDHMVLAGGVVTGDLYLQQHLARERQVAKLTPPGMK